MSRCFDPDDLCCAHTCTVCGGTLSLTGTLGNLDWFRCVNCGMDQCAPAAPITTED